MGWSSDKTKREGTGFKFLDNNDIEDIIKESKTPWEDEEEE